MSARRSPNRGRPALALDAATVIRPGADNSGELGARGSAPLNAIDAWADLRHGGLLIAAPHLRTVFRESPPPLTAATLEALRRAGARFDTGEHNAATALLDAFFRQAAGLGDPARPETGYWMRGAEITPEWSKRAASGEAIKPRQVWHGERGAGLPVFWTDETRVGVGRGKRVAARVVEWLRQRGDKLALLTNGSQWRLIHASLDHEAWAESDRERWFEEGAEGASLLAMRALLAPAALTPETEGATAPLLAAIETSRRSQAELSAELGERVRRAVERLIQEHGAALGDLLTRDPAVTPREVYRAATRVVMRMVVVLFAEARDLLPRAEEKYLGSYGLAALREQLEKAGAGQAGSVRAERLRHRFGAWPRVLALFRLVHGGSGHPGLKVPTYGGELFKEGEPGDAEPLARALHVFESAALTRGGIMSDLAVHDVLRLLTRSRVKVRAGRLSTWTEGPVDFGDLSSEYIGILYEGLLDYELRRAGDDDPVVFLALGDEPALPLSRLEPMDDATIRELLKKAKTKSRLAVAGDEEEEPEEVEAEEEPEDDEPTEPEEKQEAEAAVDEDEVVAETGDAREAARERVFAWARHAVVAGGVVRRPRRSTGADADHQRAVEDAARSLVARFVLPGEWFLVRFGGTRKGSGTFYTRPQLAVPTVHRTLRPLAFDPPAGADGLPNEDAPAPEWKPKSPEAILALRVCDPACGSGSFPAAALRFLSRSLHASLLHHRWLIEREDGRLALGAREGRPPWLDECVKDAVTATENGEELLERRLRRVVVERCIYGVDLDPLAVELAKLALWVETLDRELPFTFLDHKIRCGNSLVGCWFDRLRDFPALAWEREGGDKSHTRGTHFKKEDWTRAIKAQRERVKLDLAAHLTRTLSGQTAFPGMFAEGAAEAAHDAAARTFERLHELPIGGSAERAAMFQAAFREDPAVRAVRDAMDLWCAQWFWPADRVALAPLPSQMAVPGEEARALAHEIAREVKFFHWELEFPDVFREAGAGFDAVLGNPPWETLQPVSKEYFTDLDPLFRTYGKQDALNRQAQIFAASAADERDWLAYNARFKAYGNFAAMAAEPFGDVKEQKSFPLGSGGTELHRAWRVLRGRRRGYSSSDHSYRHQGEGKPYTYKLFLEQAHALLRDGGRMGFIVPSGLYTDKGTGDLRRLFLEGCRWEWLFGFENRDGVFDIHRSFKFGPVIAERGGRTNAVRTAFMRRNLADWEEAERYVIAYALAQVEQFSPRTRAILEIRHQRDLEITKKVYANGVLLGDESEDGWRIQYAQGDFNMTSDSDKFRPRPWWEERGYRPDVYGRWLKFAPEQVSNDTSKFLKPGWLPLEGGDFVRESSVEDLALPLYQGVMIGQLEFAAAVHESGVGARAVWRDQSAGRLVVRPQYLMRSSDAASSAGPLIHDVKLAYRRIARTSDTRTVIACPIARVPAGDSLFFFHSQERSSSDVFRVGAQFSSSTFDWQLRGRLGGTNLSEFVMLETALISRAVRSTSLLKASVSLAIVHVSWAPEWLSVPRQLVPWRRLWAITPHERLRLRAMLDAIVAELYGLDWDDLAWILRDCDHPLERMTMEFKRSLDPKGFWRVDQERHPELRHTVLSLVAFRDLKQTIAAHGNDRDRGIEAFCAQEDGDGWMLPDTLRLADLGLGHDARAREPQPVYAAMGERFLDWQLSQSVEESWRECEWHARNILGEAGYERLQRKLRGEEVEDLPQVAEAAPPAYRAGNGIGAVQPNLFGADALEPKRRKKARR